MPDKNDESIEANIARIKCFKNELVHMSSTSIPDCGFEEKWELMSSSLDGIVIYIHQQKVQCFKSDPIGDNKRQMLEDDIEEWRKFQPQESEFIFELSSCLSENLKYVVALSL